VGGQEGQVVLDRLQARLVGLDLEVADARDPAVHARAAELLLRDVLPDRRAHQVRPARAIDPRPLTIGTKSASPGMYAVPAAHGPMSAATCGMTPLATTSSRKSAPEPANREPTASWIRARPESSSQTIGIRLVSASSRSRETLISPVMPMEPAMTVKS
jgi:hypothetical protein